MSPKQTPRLIILRGSRAAHVPTDAQFRRWAAAALEDSPQGWELTVKIVGERVGRRLNRRYRKRDRATNVLSFRSELPEPVLAALMRDGGCRPLGDLVLCAPVVLAEARRQGKEPADHWAHLLIHGILHLRGLDHKHVKAAMEMERLETSVLARLGIADPYADPSGHRQKAESAR